VREYIYMCYIYYTKLKQTFIADGLEVKLAHDINLSCLYTTIENIRFVWNPERKFKWAQLNIMTYLCFLCGFPIWSSLSTNWKCLVGNNKLHLYTVFTVVWLSPNTSWVLNKHKVWQRHVCAYQPVIKISKNTFMLK